MQSAGTNRKAREEVRDFEVKGTVDLQWEGWSPILSPRLHRDWECMEKNSTSPYKGPVYYKPVPCDNLNRPGVYELAVNLPVEPFEFEGDSNVWPVTVYVAHSTGLSGRLDLFLCFPVKDRVLDALRNGLDIWVRRASVPFNDPQLAPLAEDCLTRKLDYAWKPSVSTCRRITRKNLSF